MQKDTERRHSDRLLVGHKTHHVDPTHENGAYFVTVVRIVNNNNDLLKSIKRVELIRSLEIRTIFRNT